MTATLAFSAGPIRNTEIVPRELDWAGLVDALTRPEIGDKDGSYFTRGPSTTNKRVTESIPYADIVVLDGDSRIIQETGEIEKGAPPPALVSDALKDIGVDHIIYTTHSHAPPINKYRVVIPSDRHRPEDVTDCVEYLIEQLHIRGVYLANVSENTRWPQGWFLPRLSVPDAPFETYVWNGGLSLDVRAGTGALSSNSIAPLTQSGCAISLKTRVTPSLTSMGTPIALYAQTQRAVLLALFCSRVNLAIGACTPITPAKTLCRAR
jgi:hypothetical protein